MKQNKLKQMLAVVLAGSILLTGCAGSKTGNTEKENSGVVSESKQSASTESASTESVSEENKDVSSGVTYPIEGDVTLTLAVVENTTVTASGVKNLFETPFGKAWQEQTGVTIDVMQLASGEALNLLFVGDDLPDLIMCGEGAYSGGPSAAIEDGIVQPLNDYMDCIPDLAATLEGDEEWYKACTTADGLIWGGPFIRGDEMLKTSSGIIIRQDWLDDLGLEVPRTPDEMYNVLKAFKEEKGAEVPMSMQLFWLRDIGVKEGVLTSPFGLVKGNFYVEDGTVHYGYYENEYKGVLEWLKKLYDDGLLDPNFQTIDGPTMHANMQNGLSGVCICSAGGGMGTYLNNMKDDATYNLVGAAPLVAKAGDVAMSTHYSKACTGDMTLFMTTACENKEAAAKFINYGYTEEGSMLFNFGIEGESYNMVDGYPTYTDVILKNEDGLTVAQAMAQYQMAWLAGPFVQRKEYVEQYYEHDQQKEALVAWCESDARTYDLPKLTFSTEDSAEISKLMADINVYVGEMFFNYITGVDSLDDFEDQYLAALRDMKMDRVLELYQKALDEY